MKFYSRDYETIKIELLSNLRESFPELTDDSRANNIVALVEALANALEALSYYQDDRISQCFEKTITERRAAEALANQRGYIPSPAVSAEVSLQFSVDVEFTGELTIPAGTQTYCLVGGDRIVYETLNSITLSPGSPSNTVLARQKETHEDTFVGTGEARTTVSLSRSPFAGIVSVTVDGVEWEQVIGFWQSNPSSNHYRVYQLVNGTSVIFGNGTQGRIPSKGSSIKVTYKTSYGATGNVLKNQITKLVTSYLTDGEGQRIPLNVTNPDKASGGQDAETVAEIKRNSGISSRLYGRSVCEEDFIWIAEQLTSIKRAGVVTVNNYEGIPENTVMVVVVMEEGHTYDTEIHQELVNLFTTSYPRTITLDILTAEAETFSVDHLIQWKEEDGYNRGDVETSMQQALEDYYALENRNFAFGQPVRVSHLWHILQAVEGVKYLYLTEPELDVIPENGKQLAVLGEVSFQDVT